MFLKGNLWLRDEKKSRIAAMPLFSIISLAMQIRQHLKNLEQLCLKLVRFSWKTFFFGSLRYLKVTGALNEKLHEEIRMLLQWHSSRLEYTCWEHTTLLQISKKTYVQQHSFQSTHSTCGISTRCVGWREAGSGRGSYQTLMTFNTFFAFL